MRFKAYNYDPAAKRAAEQAAEARTAATGQRHAVHYVDSYSDSMVLGWYEVRRA